MKELDTIVDEWLGESEENRKLYAEEGMILDVTEEIWAALERKGWNKKRLAKELGFSLSHVSRLLNGSRNMTLRTLADIAFVLGMRPRFRLEEGDWHTVNELQPVQHEAQSPVTLESGSVWDWSQPYEVEVEKAA